MSDNERTSAPNAGDANSDVVGRDHKIPAREQRSAMRNDDELRLDAVELAILRPECDRDVPGVAAKYGYSKDSLGHWIREYVAAGRSASFNRLRRFRTQVAALSILPIAGFIWGGWTWYVEKYDSISRTGLAITATELGTSWSPAMRKCLVGYRIDVQNKSSSLRALTAAALRLDRIPLAALDTSGGLLDYTKGVQEVFDWRELAKDHPLLVGEYAPGAHNWHTFDLAVKADANSVYAVRFRMSDDRGGDDSAHWIFDSCRPESDLKASLESLERTTEQIAAEPEEASRKKALSAWNATIKMVREDLGLK